MRNEHDGWQDCVTRFALGLIVSLAVSGASGCAALQGVNDYLAYNDTVNDFVLGWRNGVWARQAWYERKGQFYGQPQFSSFGSGFRAGYENVASGGNGCPPAIPPREYWSWKYQTPEGQAQVAAWFAGFPYGAAAAEEDGAGLYQQIQVSHWIERQYSPEFIDGVIAPESAAPGNLAPLINEPIRAPTPNIQDAPPMLDPQSRVDRAYPALAEMTTPSGPSASAVPLPLPAPGGVAPAAYYQPENWNGAAAIPVTIPVRTPNTSPLPELRASSWSTAR